jgi:hypothetical protein
MSPSARLFALEKRIIGPFQAVIPALFDSLSTTCRGPTPANSHEPQRIVSNQPEAPAPRVGCSGASEEHYPPPKVSAANMAA